MVLYFSEADCQKRGGSIFLEGCDFHRNYGMVLLSFLCNYDNLTLKLNKKTRSYTDKGWLFIGRFKVGSVQGISVFLVASKKVSKFIMSMMPRH